MKATVEKSNQHTAVLTIEADAKQFEAALQRAYKKVVQKVQVPGFRKGKVPRVILEARYGKEVLFEDALEILIPEAYAEAVTELQVEPVAQPQIEVEKIEAGQPLVFKATVTVKPEVTLGEYKGIEVDMQPVEVSDEDVEKQLQTMQKRHAQIKTLGEGEAAQLGDTAVIDFTGYKEGVPFEGGEGEDYSLELGSGSFIAGFEEGLVGAVTGQELDLNLTFPAEYHVADLAGKDVVFKVKVKEIKRREVAALDDEFAKDVSEFETLEELKADVRANLLKQAEKTQEQKRINDIVARVVDNATVDIPQVMIDNEVADMLKDYGRRLEYQGLTLEKFMELTGQTEEFLKEQFAPEAEKVVKRELVLAAVAKAEGLTVTEEEIDQEIEAMAAQYRQKPQQLRKLLASRGQIEGLAENLLLQKASALITGKTAE